MIDTIDSLKARRNGAAARPNIYKRSQEPRQTTDSFLVATAGFDTDQSCRPWYRRMKIWQLALVTLLAVALLVAMRVW